MWNLISICRKFALCLLIVTLLAPQLMAADLPGIEYVALSDDGRLAALADKDGRVHLYRVADKQVFRSVTPYPAGQVSKVMAVWPDGELVATSGPPKASVLLWAMPTGSKIELTKKVGATRLAFSPDGKYLAGALVDGRVVIWSAPDFKEETTLKNIFGVEALEWSNNGKLLALATNQQELFVWFPAKNKTLLQVKAQRESFQIFDMAFSPDGRQLFTVGGLGYGIWDVASGKLAKSIDGKTRRSYGVAWNAAENKVIDLDEKTFRVWDPKSGELLKELPADLTPHDACFSRDGTKVLYRELRMLNTSNLVFRDVGEELEWRAGEVASSTAPPSPSPVTPGSVPSVNTAVKLPKLSPGEKMLAKGEYGVEFKRLAPTSLQRVPKPIKSTNTDPVDLRATISAVGLSDDAKVIAAGGIEGEVFVGDAVTGKIRSRFRIESGDRIGRIQPSPDGKLVAVAPFSDNYVEIFTDRGEPVAHIETEDYVKQIAFSPLGTYVALGADDRVILFHLAEGAVYATLEVDPVVQAVAVSPDEQFIGIGFNNHLGIWNVAQDRIPWHFRSDAVGVEEVAFSPDGAHVVASCHGAGVLHVFKMDGTKLVSEAINNAAAIAFQSPDRLVMAGHGTSDTLLVKIPDAKVIEKYPHPSGGVNVQSMNGFAIARNGKAAVFLSGNSAPLSELKPWRAKE
jgi:WD40 repeat protein